MKTRYTLVLILGLVANSGFSQEDEKNEAEYVNETFSNTRVLWNHSVQMLPARTLEFIVSHKFGDVLTTNADGDLVPNVNEWFGLDNLADVRIAFEYGILNHFNIGLGRSKGIAQTRSVLDGYAKWQFLKQKTSGMPISLVYTGSMILPYQSKSTDSTSVAAYPTFAHRLAFNNQIHIARKFGDRLSMQVNFGVNHRNYVNFSDKNTLTFIGGGLRFRFTKNIGVIVEYHHVLNRDLLRNQNPLSVGIELSTGGHVFTFGYSNARGITETLFIPQTTSNWTLGEFRLGFGLNRRFKL
jgi:hypothetical protein